MSILPKKKRGRLPDPANKEGVKMRVFNCRSVGRTRYSFVTRFDCEPPIVRELFCLL